MRESSSRRGPRRVLHLGLLAPRLLRERAQTLTGTDPGNSFRVYIATKDFFLPLRHVGAKTNINLCETDSADPVLVDNLFWKGGLRLQMCVCKTMLTITTVA